MSLEVDSLCAAKILQLLFKNDNVQYTMVPVSGKKHLQEAYAAHIEEVLKCVYVLRVRELQCYGDVDKMCCDDKLWRLF